VTPFFLVFQSSHRRSASWPARLYRFFRHSHPLCQNAVARGAVIFLLFFLTTASPVVFPGGCTLAEVFFSFSVTGSAHRSAAPFPPFPPPSHPHICLHTPFFVKPRSIFFFLLPVRQYVSECPHATHTFFVPFPFRCEMGKSQGTAPSTTQAEPLPDAARNSLLQNLSSPPNSPFFSRFFLKPRT